MINSTLKLLNHPITVVIMKIGFAIDRYDEGVGMANVVFNLAKQLTKNHDVCVLTWKSMCSDELEELSREQGIEVEKFSFSSGLKMKIWMRRYAKKIDHKDFDVISAHGFNMANAAAISDTPVLKTNHAHTLIKSEFLNHPVRLPLWLLEEVPSVYLSEEVVSISNYARNQMKKIYRRNSDIIYNGIDLDTYQPKTKTFRNDIDSEKTVFGTLCALRPHKNIKLAIDALSNLDGDDYIYLIGGKGPKMENLKKRAEEKDVNAEFMGFIDEEKLPEFYSSLDLFLFPSLWEGFGVPVLESMACGTPAAVLNQKGPKELVKDEKTGFLLNKDKEAWTETLENFIKSDNDISKESRERAEEFSWSEASRKYENKLQELKEE